MVGTERGGLDSHEDIFDFRFAIFDRRQGCTREKWPQKDTKDTKDTKARWASHTEHRFYRSKQSERRWRRRPQSWECVGMWSNASRSSRKKLPGLSRSTRIVPPGPALSHVRFLLGEVCRAKGAKGAKRNRAMSGTGVSTLAICRPRPQRKCGIGRMPHDKTR